MRRTHAARYGCMLIACGAALGWSGCSSFLSRAPEPTVVSVETFDLTQTNAVARPEPPGDSAYRLGIGDVLAISVYGEDGSLREVPVDPSGQISFLIIGTLPAVGRTIDELRTDLQTRLSAKLARGIVQVVPVHFGSQTYTILGELNYPGTYPMEGRTTILDAIARARGIRTGYFRNSTAEMADYQNATLMRNGQVVPVDFDALVSRGDATQNVVLSHGDILSIPSSLVRNIYVLGEVNFPRTVGFVSSVSLIQALSEARGLKNSSDGRIVVVRGSRVRPEAYMVRFDHVLTGKDPNLPLAPGDIVFAPPRQLALLREIVESAITAFAESVSKGSAKRVYGETLGTKAGESK